MIKDRESASAALPKRIYLDYLKLLCTVVGTAAAGVEFAITIDSIERYSSAGTLITPVGVNMDDGRASIATMYAGNIVAAAAGSGVRQVTTTRILKRVAPVAKDEYLVNFGNVESYRLVGVDSVATVPPVIIGPQQWALIHLWLPSQTAASSFEVELGWWER